MCIDCDEEGVTRRSFLTGATIAIAGAAFASKAAGQQIAQATLNDPNVNPGFSGAPQKSRTISNSSDCPR